MSSHPGVKSLLAATVASILSAAAQGEPVYAFHIAASNNPTAAIHAFADQTGVQILASAQRLQGRRFNDVSGDLTTDAAMSRMLAGSGLRHQRVSEGVIALVSDTVEPQKLLAQVNAAPPAEKPAVAGLEEVIVTAQKRAQALEDVSLAVSAVGADMLANSQTNSIESLQYLVPSLSFGNDFNFAKLFIRGIGLNSSFPGADPSVALHVDGAVIAQAGAQMSAMFDLERVEVLRGPQGTLYGRNATGGVVNLITAKPSVNLEGYGRLTLGGPDFQTLAEGAIGGPLSNMFRARLAVRYLDREGYAKNELTGSQIDNARQHSVRASVQFLPTDDFDLLLTGEYHREKDRSNAIKFRAAAFPDAVAATPPAIDLRSLATVNGFSPSADPRNIRANVDPINDRKTYALTATASWRLDDIFTLRSITNHRDYEAEFYQDFDMSDYPGCRQPMVGPSSTCTLPAGVPRTSGNHWQPLYQYQWSEELQLNFDANKLHGLVAAYYLQEHIRIENHLGYNPVPFFSSDPADVRAIFDGSMNVKTWALFGNATYDFTDKFSAKGGARYSYEKRDVTSYQATATPPQPAPLPSALGYPYQVAKDWSNFSPQLGLEYRPRDGFLTYFTWAKGFKSGTAVIGEAGKQFVDPEKVNSFELGMKSRMLDNTLQLNVAAFYHKVKDAQFQFTSPQAAPPGFTTVMRNAAEIEAKGVEFEAMWRITRAFTLDASLAWLDSKFTSFLAPNPLKAANYSVPAAPPGETDPCTRIVCDDLSGNRTRMSPTFSATLHPSYEFDVSEGTLEVAANVVYKGKQYHTEFNDDRLASDAYTLYDANALYTAPNGRYTLNVWGKNLSDEFVWAGSYAVSSTRTIGGTLLPPRTYGVTAGVKF